MADFSSKLERLGIPKNYHKWLAMILLLVVAKYAVVPVLEWQNGLLEEIEFQQMQMRDETSLQQAQSQLEAKRPVVEEQLRALQQFYATGALPTSELALAKTVDAIANENNIEVLSRSWKTLFTNEHHARQEISLEVRCFAQELFEFTKALEAIESPKLMIVDMQARTLNRSNSRLQVKLKVHQLVLVEKAS